VTAYELVRVARRRPVSLMAGLIATLALVLTAHPEPVYWATMELRVVAPAAPGAPKTLEDPDSDPIIAATTMLTSLVNGGHVQPKSASPNTTLYGEGYRQAVSARLRDKGGQWGSSVRDAIIDVQAVDSNPSAVRISLEKQSAELTRLLSQLQDDLDVAQSQRIMVIAPSTDADVLEVGGSRVRAMASSLLIGLAVTLTSIYWIEILARRRAARLMPQRRALSTASPRQRSVPQRRPEPSPTSLRLDPGMGG